MNATDASYSYKTVSSYAEVEFVERRSRFIGICQPLKDEQEANAFVQAVRSKYPDARHHVYAWRVSGEQQLQRYSDDGEPRGTGGMPVLDTLVKADIDRAGIVVVRYFGGILLGAGGLVRAYGRAASLAVQAAKPVIWQLQRRFHLVVPYALAERLRYELEQGSFWQDDPTYALDVDWYVGCLPSEEERLLDLIRDVTSDQAITDRVEDAYVPVRVDHVDDDEDEDFN